jgi:hypothetical protein
MQFRLRDKAGDRLHLVPGFSFSVNGGTAWRVPLVAIAGHSSPFLSLHELYRQKLLDL